MVVGIVPRRNSFILTVLLVSNNLIMVPLNEATATKFPTEFTANCETPDLFASKTTFE